MYLYVFKFTFNENRINHFRNKTKKNCTEYTILFKQTCKLENLLLSGFFFTFQFHLLFYLIQI